MNENLRSIKKRIRELEQELQYLKIRYDLEMENDKK